jgi:hypothetical protein
MMKALKKLNNGYNGSSLLGSKLANSDIDIMEEETGEWHYLVVDSSGVRPREDACYTKDTKRTDLDRIKEGTVVKVDRRRRSGWTKWLSLTTGEGWLFDVSPKDKKVRMVEVEVAAGEWQYVVTQENVPVLSKPSLHLAALKSSKKAQVLEYKEVVSAREKVRPLNGKGSFLRLSDGRGWVQDFANGRQVLQRWEVPRDNCGSSSMNQPAEVVDITKQELCEPELGNWEYIVLDPKGICLRSSPTYDKSEKNQWRLEEGEIVHVVERRIGNGTTFLHIENQGWAFDTQPCSSKRRQRLAQVNVESGSWFYRVCATKGVAPRSRCTFSENCKVGQGPSEGALVEVCRRVKVGEATFLKLKEGDGWIFDVKSGKAVVEGPFDVEMPPDVTATVQGNAGIYLLSAPTQLHWAVTKKLLLPGARAQVTHICNIEGSRWARIRQPNGNMDGWVLYDSLHLIRGEAGRQFDAQQVRAALDAPNPRCGQSISWNWE